MVAWLGIGLVAWCILSMIFALFLDRTSTLADPEDDDV